MKTHRYTEDSTPSEDPKTGPRKTLAKNAKNVMFYHLRGVRAPRTSTDFQPYLIYEDIRVLGSISKASGGVCVCVSFPNIKQCLTMSRVQSVSKQCHVYNLYEIYWNQRLKAFLDLFTISYILLKLKIAYTSSIYFVFRRFRNYRCRGSYMRKWQYVHKPWKSMGFDNFDRVCMSTASQTESLKSVSIRSIDQILH